MAKKSYSKRDQHMTRFIHFLFLRAMLQDKKNFALSLLYFPHFFIVHAYIPFEVAYALQAILTRQFDQVQGYVVHILFAAVLTSILNYTANLADNRMTIFATSYVQRKIFSNFLEKDNEFYSSQFVGSLGVQASQLREAMSLYSHEWKFQVMKNTTIVVTAIVIIALKAPLLSLITITCMIFVLSFTIATSSHRLRHRRKASEAGSELAGVIGDSLSHGTTVKSFASENYELKHAEPALKKWQRATLRAFDTVEPSNSGRTILSYISIAVLLLVTANLYKAGDISIAIVILVQLYMFKLIIATLDVADIIKQYEQIMGMAYKPALTMQVQPKITDIASPKKLPKKPKQIRFDEISFAYDENANKKVISKFDLTVNEGEKIGLVGYSGAGKTTLTKLLLRFMDITEGSIKFDGVDIRECKQSDLRRVVSYVPQEPLLFHRSIYENIAYGRPDVSKKEVLNAAKLAYVDDFVNDLPEGYDTLVGERGVKLSGGQRQRVAIARAILKDASILVLDEATSALDSRSEKYIQDALLHLMEDKTSIVIAHRLSTIQRMDKVIVIDKGKIVQTGTHSSLYKTAGIYGDLWKHQTGGYIGA